MNPPTLPLRCLKKKWGGRFWTHSYAKRPGGSTPPLNCEEKKLYVSEHDKKNIIMGLGLVNGHIQARSAALGRYGHHSIGPYGHVIVVAIPIIIIMALVPEHGHTNKSSNSKKVPFEGVRPTLMNTLATLPLCCLKKKWGGWTHSYAEEPGGSTPPLNCEEKSCTSLNMTRRI